MTRLPLALLTAVLLLAACAPAPELTPTPLPIPTAVHPPATIPPYPPPVTRPAIPSTLTPIPTSTTVPTRTPEAYPVHTPETPGPEPNAAEGETVVLPRLGVSNASGQGFVLCDGRQWQMSWGANNVVSDCFFHVPMLAWGTDGFEEVRAGKTARNNDHDYWLVYNECEALAQCGATPEEAARFYHDVLIPWVEVNDPAARLIVGGGNAGECGMEWLEQFFIFYRTTYGEDVPRAGLQFHLYPDIWAGYQCEKTWEWSIHILMDVDSLWRQWLADAERIKRFMLVYGREGDEVWISEFSCLAPYPACKEDTPVLASRALAWFDGDGRWVTRYSWFSDFSTHWWVWSNLYAIDPKVNESQFTAVGNIYLNHTPSPSVPLRIYHRYFPILGYGGITAATPAPLVYPTATPPAGYPVPGDLHP